MKQIFPKSWSSFSPQWRWLIITVLLIGIFFRFYNLDRKAYWFDETFTSLQASGYTVKEIVEQLPKNRPFSVETLKQFQTINSEKNFNDVVRSLAVEDAHHTPLYHILLRIWMQIFGSSVAAVRSFSAVLSLLAFPALYWLCLELFESQFTAWIALALFAVSPFEVLYAQEAREYSLWIVTILLTSATLLRAIRHRTQNSWGLYTFSLTLLLYTHIFSLLVAFGHGMYVAIIERLKWRKNFIYYLLSTGIAVLFFVPWILVIINNKKHIEQSVGWTLKPSNPLGLIKFWLLNLSRLFLDTDLEGGIIDWGFKNTFTEVFRLIVVLVIACLVVYSFYFLWRNSFLKVWTFILILTGSFAVPFVLSDWIIKSQITTVTRYFIPTYLGIQLAVAYLLSTQLSNLSLKSWQQTFYRALFVSILSLGILSCVTNSQATSWWNKSPSRSLYNIEITKIINQAKSPLVISDQTINDLLALSHTLNPEVQLQWITSSKTFPDTSRWLGFTDIYVYRPSGKLKNYLKNQDKMQLKSIYHPEEIRLWKLVSK